MLYPLHKWFIRTRPVIELIINVQKDEVAIALLKDRKLIELNNEQSNNNFNVGDIYIGKTRKVVPGLNAAFVNVGYEKDAFLHYLDLGPQFESLNKYTKATMNGRLNNADLTNFKIEPDIDKHGKVTNVLTSNQHIMVQIAKEPISSKGPRLSSEITLAGRYIVLVPFSNKISISQRIKDPAERERLKRLLLSIRPKNFGVIIRTVAQNKKVAELDSDLRDLINKWNTIHKGIKSVNGGYKKVLGELNRTSAMLRDILSADFGNVIVNDAALFQDIKSYVATIAPDKEKIVKHHTSKKNIFEHYGINKQVKGSFGKHVTMASGAYLIVEHTEAMHVIDVNSGSRKSTGKTQEQNAIETNLEAAEEVARQLRLRDMGGIIVIDFIDMNESANRKKLFEKLKEHLRDDRAKHNLIPVSKFGVVEITRQRVRPETEIKTAEVCPTCNGTGEVQATILVVDEIESALRKFMEEKKKQVHALYLHPFIAAYFQRKIYSRQMQWFVEHKKWLRIVEDSALQLPEFRFVNKANEEIKA